MQGVIRRKIKEERNRQERKGKGGDSLRRGTGETKWIWTFEIYKAARM